MMQVQVLQGLFPQFKDCYRQGKNPIVLEGFWAFSSVVERHVCIVNAGSATLSGSNGKATRIGSAPYPWFESKCVSIRRNCWLINGAIKLVVVQFHAFPLTP